MKCPRCQALISDEQCAGCGYRPEPATESAASPPDASKRKGQDTIQFEASVHNQGGESRSAVDWRAELKKKLIQHAEKKGMRSEPGGAREEPGSKEKPSRPAAGQSGKPPEEEKPSIFDYRLRDGEVSRRQRKIVTLPREQSGFQIVQPQSPPDSGAGSESTRKKRGSRQIRLDLQSEQPRSETPPEDQLTSEPAEKVTREILVSRYLAGIIDLCIPLGLAIIFTLTASLILEFDFFQAESLLWTGFFAVCFFYLNSFYFLFAIGQTPGMFMTGLKLVSAEGESLPSGRAIVVRVLLFVPVLLTLIGLLWCLFDPRYRGLHDTLSGTQVEPLNTEGNWKAGSRPASA